MANIKYHTPDNGTVWIAEMESRSFSWLAMGATKEQAIAALEDGLKRHATTNQCEKNWYSGYSVTLREFRHGSCYRDDFVMTDRAEDKALRIDGYEFPEGN